MLSHKQNFVGAQQSCNHQLRHTHHHPGGFCQPCSGVPGRTERCGQQPSDSDDNTNTEVCNRKQLVPLWFKLRVDQVQVQVGEVK